jgi:hypothetical protein
MALIGIPYYGTKCSFVGRTCGLLRFFDQITQGLFADGRKDDIAHDAIRFIQGRAGDFEQQVLLAADTFQIIEQFALDPMLGTCADVVDGFDEQINQVIGQRRLCRCTKAASQVSLAGSGCRRSS